MKLGILKEIKSSENRVILIPEDVSRIADAGHEVFVEAGAGEYSGFSDALYESAGASISPSSEKIFQNVELILKVQPPVPVEYELYTSDHVSFSFLHLSNSNDLMAALMERGAIFFAAELVKNINSHRSVLSAMNEISGRMAVINAAKFLEKPYGGKGILLSGTGENNPAKISIIGTGVAGMAAAQMANSMGADVTLIDYHELNDLLPHHQELNSFTVYDYSRAVLREILLETDVLISSVSEPGVKTPMLVSREDIHLLKPGSVVIDLFVDKGASIETSRPTTIEDPTYIYEGIVHSAIINLPSAVPHTSSRTLSNAALPYIKQIAQLGPHEAIAISPEIRSGLAVYHGKVVNHNLASLHQQEFYDILELFELNI